MVLRCSKLVCCAENICAGDEEFNARVALPGPLLSRETWLAEEGVTPEIRARLGGWTVRGMRAMDDYTHLIEPLWPIAEILATKWNTALALRRTRGPPA